MKRFTLFLVFSLLFFAHAKIVLAVNADDKFSQKLQINYIVREDGIVDVENSFEIKNLTSETYLSHFTFVVSKTKPLLLSAEKDGLALPFEESIDGDKVSVDVALDDDAVGKGELQDFSINYSSDSFTKKTGDTWEILIPKINDIDKYENVKVTLTIPDSFGERSYISPMPIRNSNSESNTLYEYDKISLTDTGISAGFGKFQLFAFTLNYHLENSTKANEEEKVAIPPDTSFQSLIYTSIEPGPKNVEVDEDGNWIAIYQLDKNERLDVVVKGFAKIFSSPQTAIVPSVSVLNKNLEATKYWQANNDNIRQLAGELKTPKNIYNYVVDTLNYNPDRATPNSERLGAIGALSNPADAICTEFTDSFIAIARAAGIPAREINGFAYTENPDVQPISLVADVLHAWPEYWDKEKNLWIPVDPTWGSTSGINYFDNMDLRHFAFVIHGTSDTVPLPPGSFKLGNYPQKDIFVSFGQLDKDYEPEIEIEATSKNYLFFTRSVETTIRNTGNVAIYQLDPKLYFDDKLTQTDFVGILPPYSVYTKKYNLSLTSLGRKTPDNIYFKYLDKEVEIKTKKGLLFASQMFLIFIVVIFLGILAIRFYRARKLKEIKKYEIF